MNILVTAGNTQTPIDRVRCLTNIFTGRTGAAIAATAGERGHRVTLLTSHPETTPTETPFWNDRGATIVYRTFDDLQIRMASLVPTGEFDAVIHAAAVSDYVVSGIYAPATHTEFQADERTWRSNLGSPTMLDRAAGKIKSRDPELWLRLIRAPKIVDRIRADWGFRGKLVKFKLEVGLSDSELLEIGEQSRRESHADWMVANTLEAMAEWAFLGPFADGYHKIRRQDLPSKLLEAIERRVA